MLPPVQRISSRQNPLVARFRATARGDVPNLVLLDGRHLVEEALAAGVPLRHVAIAAARVDEMAEFVARLAATGVEIATVSAPVLAAMSPLRSPGAVVALADRPANHDVYARTPLVLVVVDVQDPGNVGAVIRVAEAAGATGVVVSGGTADPYGWKALRGSMGSALRLPVRRAATAEEAVNDARHHACRIVAAVPRGGRTLANAALRGACAILIGGEGAGLADTVVASADETVTIPMEPPVESLNAAVSAAILAYEARRQRTAAAAR